MEEDFDKFVNDIESDLVPITKKKKKKAKKGILRKESWSSKALRRINMS